MRTLRTTWLAALVWVVVLGGCASATNDNSNYGARLELQSSSIDVPTNAEETIEVQYLRKDGSPIADGEVEFFIDGTRHGGARLSPSVAVTDDDGWAEITLVSRDVAQFDILVEAKDAAQEIIAVDVDEAEEGTLRFEVTYNGRRVIEDVEVVLFEGTTCERVRRSVPNPSEHKRVRLNRGDEMDNVQMGRTHALYALGINSDGGVEAEVCKDVEFETSPSTEFDLRLADSTMSGGGSYDVVTTLDMTSGLHWAVDGMLDLIEGLYTDPAGYLLDLVIADGSLGGALSAPGVRAIISGYIQDFLDDLGVPGWITSLGEMAANFNHAMSEVRLRGTLQFDDPDELGVAEGYHRISEVEMPLIGSGEIRRSISASARVKPVLNVRIELPEHALRIPAGEIVEALFRDTLLPRLPGAPRSIQDFARKQLDCAAFADWLVGTDDIYEDIANAACDIGVAIVAQMAEDALLSLWDFDTLHLSAIADLDDSDGDRVTDYIEEGDAFGRWTKGSETMGGTMTTGTFEGERDGEAARYEHPILEKINIR